MSECLYGDPELKCSDLRDETCTNLSIRLSLLLKKMKIGDRQKIVVTQKQFSQIDGIPERNNIQTIKERMNEDVLITLEKKVIDSSFVSKIMS